MAPGKNNEFEENAAPKKADVLIRGNQEITQKQDEVIRQTKLSVSRTDAALEMFSKNIQDTAMLVKRNGEYFEELKNENAALKQELLYLAKQSENIYAGLSEKITELNETAKNRELAYGALADKINDVSEQTRLGQDVYADIADKINELSEQNKHSETVYYELADKVADLSEQTKRSESVYTELSDKMEVISAQTLRSETAFSELDEKLAALNEIDEKLSALNGLDEKLVTLAQIDEKLAALTEVDEKLAALNDIDEKLKTIEGFDEKLAALAGIDERLAALDGLDEKLVALAGIDEKLVVLDGLDEKIKVFNEIDEKLATLNELDEKLKTFSEIDEKLAALNELDEKLKVFNELDDKLNALNELDEKLKVFNDLDRKLRVFNELDDKLSDITEQNRRSENAYNRLTDRVESLSMRVERIGDDASIRIAAPVLDTTPVPVPVQSVVREEIDIDALAEKVASAVSAREVVSPDYIASKVAEQVIFPDREGANVTLSVDEELIAKHVADFISLNGVKVINDTVAPVEVVSAPAEPVIQNVPVEIDEEALAEKIASKIGTVNIDEENIADKIAGKITTFTVDENNIAERIADRINTLNIDGDNLADKIALKVNTLNLDEEELADRIALKVGSLKAEDFEILVDDEGCSSISKEITDKLDYNAISAVISEKLTTVLELAELNAPDYEEMAQRISEKITVAGINEDAIADKAAAVLSNYLPEIDADDISEKVTSAVIDLLNTQAQATQPVVDIDNDTICNTISERLIESQADHDYDIVIDEDGISKITELVSEEIEKETGERFAKIDETISEIKDKLGESITGIKDELGESITGIKDQLGESIADIKELLNSGVVVAAPSNEIATAEAAYEPAYPAEEELVTVSDLVKPEETAAEPEEESEEDDEEAIEQIEDDLSDGEALFAHGNRDGVDFENMMKYNRSFIARVIQGSDEQKQFYGAVKQALLSYRKVNSNIAWAAERFNKGRETIARFKIRGKTLCLYLALDPNDYKASVYHHANVIDNKSMNGTPMMVKIKSPLGVKKAIRLIDEMLEKRGGIKREVPERDYAAMYPYENIEELIEDGLVKDVQKNK